MKKISTVFVVNRETGQATNVVRPENQWVVDGEGIATVKFDGSSCLYKNGMLYKRFDKKLNKKGELLRKRKGDKFYVTEDLFRALPEGAIPCVETYDPVTFHFPHWVPVFENAPEDYRHNEALRNFKGTLIEGQTYELVGPDVDKNNYNLSNHELWEHASEKVELQDFSFETLKKYVVENNIEGLVFHHPDGRMAKLRRKDFSKSNERDWNWLNATPDEFI